MSLRYKSLWVLLAQKNVKSQFRNTAGFSSATLTKPNDNEIVALSVQIKNL